MKTLKNRVLKGWTFSRFMFVLIGSFIIIQAVLDGHWYGVVLGAYVAFMGIFAFGCASGNCNYIPPTKSTEEIL